MPGQIMEQDRQRIRLFAVGATRRPDAQAAVARRRISPVELLDALRARFDALEPRLNTTIRPLWEEAREQARKATRRIARSSSASKIAQYEVNPTTVMNSARTST